MRKYDGPEVVHTSKESNNKQHLLKYLYGENLHIIENALDGRDECLDKEITVEGIKYHLLFSQKKTSGSKTMYRDKEMNKRYMAYYLGGKGFETANDVKLKMEWLGDLGSLALKPGKLASRLEMMVSPSCTQFNGIYNDFQIEDFELIEENQHVGKFPFYFHIIYYSTEQHF